MKFLKTLPILLLAILLTACDRGARNPNASCEPNYTSSVEGFSGETMPQDKGIQVVYSVLPESTQSAISPNDLAKKCLEEEIKKNPSKTNLIEANKPLVKTILYYFFEVPMWIMLAYTIWSIFYFIWILSTRPKLDYSPEKERYTTNLILFNFFKFAVLLALLIPSGQDNTNVLQRYVLFNLFKTGNENALYTNSVSIAEEERGKLEQIKLSEASQKYSPLAFKAWTMTNFMFKGQLRDNRTAKAEYHEALLINGKYALPVEHPETMQYVYRSSDQIELKRFTMVQDDKNKQKVRSLLSYSGKVKFTSLSTSEETRKIIATDPEKFLAKTPEEIPAKAEVIKQALIAKHGEEITKNVDFINKAIVEVLFRSLPALVEKQILSQQNNVKEGIRLVEELNCTYTPASPAIKYEVERFIKRVAAGDFWGKETLINRCVGQSGTKLVGYGQRPYEQVEAELNAKYREVYNNNYEYLVSISGATKGITIDKNPNNYCQMARNKGVQGMILHYDECKQNNIVQRELTDYVTQSFTFESVGFDHYIDTESRKNDDFYKGLANFQDDFDPIMEKLFKTIEVNPAYGDIPHEEYLRSIADSYNTKEAQSSSITSILTSPIDSFKQAVGEVDEKSDPTFVKEKIKETFINGVKAGSYLITLGLGASAIDNALDMNKNKTSKTDTGYSGKGNGKLQKMIGGFVKLLTASFSFGLAIVIGSALGLFYLALPKVIFTVAYLAYLVRFFQVTFNANFALAKYVRFDDENNLKHHSAKIFNEGMYFLLTPTLIIFMLHITEFFESEAMISAAQYILTYPISTMMEGIALIIVSAFMIWMMTAFILGIVLTSYKFIKTEIFGISETDAIEEFFHNACMKVITWSFPFVGSILAKMLIPKRKK
ncbi:TPA: hypothetical protein ACXKAZ_001846 [Pseudomonas aeruginosa]